jgi:anti-sigma regulatory factor (Ser/Thr protein kinase)
MVLIAVPEAVSAARRFVTDALPASTERDLLDDAELVVSELATNAVRHASSAFRLSIRRDGPSVRVAVEDGDRRSPRERHPSPEEHSGRGVGIVGTLASRWGYDVGDDGKVVWAELVES